MQLSELWRSYSELTTSLNKNGLTGDFKSLMNERDALVKQAAETNSLSVKDVGLKLQLLREEIENEIKGNRLVDELMTSIEDDVRNLSQIFDGHALDDQIERHVPKAQ